MLTKLVADPDHILTYNGTVGAGWLAAYASDILGLPTCGINVSGHTHVISGKLEAARVLIRVSDTACDARCEISIGGRVEDFIQVGTLTSLERSGWSIDCSKLSFVDMNLPRLRQHPEFRAISEFAAVEMMNTLSDMALMFSDEDTLQLHSSQNWQLPLPYYLSEFQNLSERALKTLHVLGFNCPPIGDYKFEAGLDKRQPYCIGCVGAPLIKFIDATCGVRAENQFVMPKYSDADVTVSWATSLSQERQLRLRSYVKDRADMETPREKANEPKRWPHEKIKKVSEMLDTAVYLAAGLAFTDWNDSLRILPIRYFQLREQAFFPPEVKAGSLKWMLRNIVPLCTDNYKDTLLAVSDDGSDWVGSECDGLGVLSSTTLQQSIPNLHGLCLEFRLGHISYQDTKVELIWATRPINLEFYNLDTWLDSNGEQIVDEEHARDAFLTTSDGPSEIRQTFTLRRNALWLKLEYLDAARRWHTVDPNQVSDRIRSLYVTSPCVHQRNDQVLAQGFRSYPKGFRSYAKVLDTGSWVSGVTMEGDRQPKHSIKFGGEKVNFCYLLFEGDIDNAWLSCMTEINWSKHPISQADKRILQRRDTCLLCTLHQVSTLDRILTSFQDIRNCYCIVPYDVGTPNIATTTFPPDLCHELDACLRHHTVPHPNPKKHNPFTTPCPGTVHTPCCLQGSALAREDPDCIPEADFACMFCRPHRCTANNACEYCKVKYKDDPDYQPS